MQALSPEGNRSGTMRVPPRPAIPLSCQFNPVNSLAMAKLSHFVGSLGLGALASPLLTDRQRQFVLQCDGDLGLGGVAAYLRGASWPDVDEVFNTEVRRYQLRAAYLGFLADLGVWKQRDRWSAQFTWVLPPPMAAGVIFRRDRKRLEDFLNAVATLSALPPRHLRTYGGDAVVRRMRSIRRLQLGTYRSAHLWMPYLSIEGVRAVGNLRNGDTARLIVAFAIGVDRLGLSSQLRPWSAKVPGRVQALPLTWLYQFEPNRRLEEVLSRLSSAGYRNLGHLATLHPEVISKLTSKHVADWIGLQMILETLYSAEE